MRSSLPGGIPRDQVYHREPPGVRIRIGQKTPDGSPGRKNVFQIVEAKCGSDNLKAPHPDFASFNFPTAGELKAWSALQWDACCPTCKGEGKQNGKRCRTCEGFGEVYHPDFIARRATIKACLVYPEWGDNYSDNFLAWKLPGTAPPKGCPACIGGGGRALRWLQKTRGADAEQIEMECPGNRCEYQQLTTNAQGYANPRLCKPVAAFHGLLRWGNGSPMPWRFFRFVTSSNHTVAAFEAFYKQMMNVASALGIRQPDFTGMPVALNLRTQKGEVAGKPTSFPVVDINFDGESPIAFFQNQAAKMQELRAIYARDRLALPGPAGMVDAATIEEDHEIVTPNYMPVDRGEA